MKCQDGRGRRYCVCLWGRSCNAFFRKVGCQYLKVPRSPSCMISFTGSNGFVCDFLKAIFCFWIMPSFSRSRTAFLASFSIDGRINVLCQPRWKSSLNQVACRGVNGPPIYTRPRGLKVLVFTRFPYGCRDILAGCSLLRWCSWKEIIALGAGFSPTVKETRLSK